MYNIESFVRIVPGIYRCDAYIPIIHKILGPIPHPCTDEGEIWQGRTGS